MPKKLKKKKYNHSFILTKRFLLSSVVALIMLFYSWLSETLFTAQLPNSERPVELYSTEMRNDLCDTYSQAIKEAKSSVTLVIYTLTDPKIINSLKEKGSSGCLVKVICDAKTSPDLEALLGPQVKILRRYLKGLTHTKMLIIDEKQTWIGSANMTRESLRHHGNLVAAIESEPLATMALAKARSFTSTERMQRFPHHLFSLGQQSVELWFLPDDSTAIPKLKALIQEAKKCIRIAMFTWTRRDLALEVIAAKKRGVQVSVVLDRSSAMGAGEKVTQMLVKGGIPVKLGQGSPLLHHKFMEIDSKILVNGSANWTKAAFETNDDCFIVLQPLLESQQNFLNETWDIIDHDSEFLNSTLQNFQVKISKDANSSVMNFEGWGKFPLPEKFI